MLLGKKSEVWFVTEGGRHVAVPVRFPLDVVTVADSALVIGADRASLIAWASREVTAEYPAGPEPARLVPLSRP